MMTGVAVLVGNGTLVAVGVAVGRGSGTGVGSTCSHANSEMATNKLNAKLHTTPTIMLPGVRPLEPPNLSNDTVSAIILNMTPNIQHPPRQRTPSIGCAPCTRAVQPGEDERSGRWWWESDPDAKECGIHTVAPSG